MSKLHNFSQRMTSLVIAAALLFATSGSLFAQATPAEREALKKAEEKSDQALAELNQALDGRDTAQKEWTLAQQKLNQLYKQAKPDPDEVKRLKEERDRAQDATRTSRAQIPAAQLKYDTANRALCLLIFKTSFNVGNRAKLQGDLTLANEEFIKAAKAAPRNSPQQLAALKAAQEVETARAAEAGDEPPEKNPERDDAERELRQGEEELRRAAIKAGKQQKDIEELRKKNTQLTQRLTRIEKQLQEAKKEARERKQQEERKENEDRKDKLDRKDKPDKKDKDEKKDRGDGKDGKDKKDKPHRK